MSGKREGYHFVLNFHIVVIAFALYCVLYTPLRGEWVQSSRNSSQRSMPIGNIIYYGEYMMAQEEEKNMENGSANSKCDIKWVASK